MEVKKRYWNRCEHGGHSVRTRVNKGKQYWTTCEQGGIVLEQTVLKHMWTRGNSIGTHVNKEEQYWNKFGQSVANETRHKSGNKSERNGNGEVKKNGLIEWERQTDRQTQRQREKECVCERERGRERECVCVCVWMGGGERMCVYVWVCVYVSVCVYVWERHFSLFSLFHWDFF